MWTLLVVDDYDVKDYGIKLCALTDSSRIYVDDGHNQLEVRFKTIAKKHLKYFFL